MGKRDSVPSTAQCSRKEEDDTRETLGQGEATDIQSTVLKHGNGTQILQGFRKGTGTEG